MTDHDDTERILRDALDAQARRSVPDARPAPPMGVPTVGRTSHRAQSTGGRHRTAVWLAPLAAAVVVAAVVLASTFAFRGHSTSGNGTVAGPVGSTSAPSSTAGPSASTSPSLSPSSSASSAATGTPVRVTSDLDDGEKVGVGMPIVLNFSPAPTDSTAFTQAVTVTVNGQPATGSWYWEKPYADQPVQAHYREQGYWPADATIAVKLPIGGLSAGPGLVYSGALTSVTFTTGDAHISTVNATTLQMTVTDNGKVIKELPVSLGAAATPTFNGTKVVMQKGEDVPGTDTLRPNGTVMMSGPGYSNDPVPWSVRITASGEYVHAAGWNTQIGIRSTSNGCTNLKPADGEWFYDFAQVGDVVTYVNANGGPMNPLDGLGDWNISWTQWAQGGLLVNH